MTSRRRALAALSLVVLLVAAGCGIRGDGDPRDIATDDVPFGLLDPTTTTTAAFPPESGTPVMVYLVDSDGRLVRVNRLVQAEGALGAMQGLLQPVTQEELDQGLTNSIPTGTEVLGIEDGPDEGSDKDTVVVNLSKEFFSIQGPVQVAAVAQVVWTLTDLPSVAGVRFAFEGEIRPVPRGDGETTSDPLGRGSFPDLAPET